MKLVNKLILSITFSSMLIGVTNNNDASANSIDSETINSSVESNIQEVSLNEVNDSLDGYLYVGRRSCPNCGIFETELKNYLQDKDVTVYYLDVDKYLNSDLSTTLINFLNNNNIMWVPDLIALKDSEVINRISNDERDSNEIFEEFFNAKVIY